MKNTKYLVRATNPKGKRITLRESSELKYAKRFVNLMKVQKKVINTPNPYYKNIRIKKVRN